MISTKGFKEVAEQQAGLIEERYPGYRAELARCLIQIISAQDDGLRDRTRREQVRKLIEAFGATASSALRRDMT